MMAKKKQITQTKPTTNTEESTIDVEPSVTLEDTVLPNQFKVTPEEKAVFDRVNEVKPAPIVETVTEEVTDGLVNVLVLKGTVKFELGTFEQGDTFQITRERLKGLDQRFVKIV